MSRASLILQGDTKAAETAHNKAAEATGRARFHDGDLPGLSHAADKETGIRLAAAAKGRVVFVSYQRGDDCEIHLCVFEQRLWGAAGGIGNIGESLTFKVTCTENFPGVANRRVATQFH